MDINEKIYKYEKIINTLENNYILLTNIYNELNSSRTIISNTILVNDKIFSYNDYNNILNMLNINRNKIKSVILPNIKDEYYKLLEEIN